MHKPAFLPLLALSLILLAGTARAGDVVHLYNWIDYFAADTLSTFEKRTGIHPTLDLYDSNEVLEPRLFAGDTGYDLVFPSALPFAAREREAGLFRPLDKSRLAGLANLDPKILKSLAKIDPGNRYLVPYMWGTTGLGLNVGMVQKAIGGEVPLDTWKLIFDPAYASKLAACGISLLDSPTEVLPAALAYLGRDPDSLARDDLRAAAALIRSVRPYIRNFDSSDYVDNLVNGEVCVALGYSGDILQAQEQARAAGTDTRIYYAIPREGAAMWIDVMAIPRDAPDPDTALDFINYLLEPATIAAISNELYYANPNLGATPLIAESLRYNTGIFPPPAMKMRLFTPARYTAEEMRILTRLWKDLQNQP